MAAATGVNEGGPQEPIEAGPARAELAEAVPAEGVPAEAVPAPIRPADGEAEPAPPEAGEAGATGDVAAAGPTEGGPGEPDGEGRERGRDFSPLAVAGMVAGILALVAAAVVVLAVITHGFRPKTVVTYRPAAVFGLRPGECVSNGPNDLSVTTVSCATAHDAEVFARFSLPASPWPGAAAVRQDASSGCASRFAGYLNPQLATAALAQEYVYPNRTAWQAGVRTVICEVRADSGRLTGSVGRGG